jgi:hypothetical protein
MTPNYPSGERIKVNDKVIFGNDLSGVVVAVIDDNSYSKEFTREQWGHYKTGVLVDTKEIGLTFYQEDEYLANFKKIG